MATTHTVVKGDTLWSIAAKYLGDGNKYKQLAAINNISNPNLLYVGQVIKLTNSGGGSSSGGGSANTNKATITRFGLQSNTENTLFATWNWSRENTENYRTKWYYDTGDGHWFVGSDSTTKYAESTYNIPANAKRVLFRVQPISQKRTVNNKETSYWTASWSTDSYYDVKDSPPKTPSVPSVEVDGYKLTAELDNIETVGAESQTSIQFQIVRDDSRVFKTGQSKVLTSHASFSCNIDPNGKYKARCRAIKNDKHSDWSQYSSNVWTAPGPIGGITKCNATASTSVHLAWLTVPTAKTYSIEYATKKEYFDITDQTSTIGGIEYNHYEIIGLESGNEYFFRVKAVNDKGESPWSTIKSIVLGKKPGSPTTWSSTTTVISGEPLYLYWVHNTEDGSSETYAELELSINGTKNTYTIKKSTDEELKDKTSSYQVNTSSYSEGVAIQWRVRTAGITKEYGEWSVQRSIDIYAPPTLELSMTDVEGSAIETLTSFPFYISGLAGPNTQAPIGYYVSITANSAYETVDQLGNKNVVNKGDQVYGKYFDISEALLIELSANHIDLENNISYTVLVTASMNSGLTAESSLIFSVAWQDEKYEPNAEISIDSDSLVAYVRPYCEETTTNYHKVTKNGNTYTKTADVIDNIYGELLDGTTTTTGESVYEGVTGDGEEIYYCVETTKSLVDDILLSVYRREFDGAFTELATGLDNSRKTFITDPHPALDYARYRVVAITKSTGSVSYYDVPGYYVGEKSIVIQWNEEWSNFDTYSEDLSEEQPWEGSLLKLPYNIDVSDNHASDVSLIKYIGRQHPVSYYGTQRGETSSWNVEIPKDNIETLYAIRRLAVWMGDVYVREPSGSGYWANISVSFSQTHCKLTIPVSFSITRVEGGA